MKNYLQAFRGVSLIELLVSIAISSFILLWLTSTLWHTDKSYRLLNEMLALESSGQVALYHIQKNMQLAGYRQFDLKEGHEDLAIDYPAEGTIFEAGEIVKSIAPSVLGITTQKVGTVNLVSRVREDEFSQLLDCMGTIVPADSILTTVFYINTANELMCRVNTTGVYVEDVIATDILQLKVVYGVADINGIETRIDSSSMTSENYVNVTSVAFGIVAESDTTQGGTEETYKVFGQALDKTSTHLHSFFSGNVLLPNANKQ